MNIFLALGVGAVVMTGVAGLSMSYSRVDHKAEQRDAVTQVDQYRVFMAVADQYMAKASPVTVNTVISWDILRVSKAAPPGAREVGMPGSWRIVQTPASGWVACTEMDERSIGLLSQLAPRPSVSTGSTTVTAPGLVPVSNAGGEISHVVIGTPTAAVSLASICS